MTASKKFFALGMACALLAANVYAQDDWGDDSFDSASEESAEPTFWDRFKISGDATLAGRAYVGEYANHDIKPVQMTMEAKPQLKLGLDYDGASTKFSSKIRFDEQTLLHNQEMILDEFSADMFVGDWVLSAGKMKVVWGKGDKLHVLDNFNSNNYYDFLIPDYLDRRNAEYMFRAQYNSPLGFRVEGIYTPIMHGETYAAKGPWKPAKVDTLTNLVKQIQAANILTAAGPNGELNQGSLAALMNASSLSADDLYPDTFKLEYGQFGGYVNFSLAMFDFGVSYYNGRYKQVSTNLAGFVSAEAIKGYAGTPYENAIKAALGSYAENPMPTLHYDKLQAFGLDMQTALGPCTVRAEFVYNMTRDFDGDDPWTHNNSLGYLFGFDVGIPLHNLTLNVQTIGNVVLKKDALVDNKLGGFVPTKTYDVDYDPTGCYTNHKLVVQLQDKFYYEKVTATIKAIYGFERADLVLMPELSFKVRDGWKITGSGLIIHNFDKKENSEFNGWLDNSFVQLAVNYTF